MPSNNEGHSLDSRPGTWNPACNSSWSLKTCYCSSGKSALERKFDFVSAGNEPRNWTTKARRWRELLFWHGNLSERLSKFLFVFFFNSFKMRLKPCRYSVVLYYHFSLIEPTLCYRNLFFCHHNSRLLQNTSIRLISFSTCSPFVKHEVTKRSLGVHFWPLALGLMRVVFPLLCCISNTHNYNVNLKTHKIRPKPV